MRAPALLVGVALAAAPHALAAQCDVPATPRAPRDPLSKLIAAMHAPRPATGATATARAPLQPVARRTRGVTRRASTVRGGAPVHRVARQARRNARPEGVPAPVHAVAASAASRPAACRAASDSGLPLPDSVVAELTATLTSPLAGATAAPALGPVPAADALRTAVPSATLDGRLGAVGAVSGIGAMSGVSAGVVVGAAATAGAAGGIWGAWRLVVGRRDTDGPGARGLGALAPGTTVPTAPGTTGDLPTGLQPAGPQPPPSPPVLPPSPGQPTPPPKGETDGPPTGGTGAGTPPSGGTPSGANPTPPAPPVIPSAPPVIPPAPPVIPPAPPVGGGMPWLPPGAFEPGPVPGLPFPEIPLTQPTSATHQDPLPEGSEAQGRTPRAETQIPEPATAALLAAGIALTLLSVTQLRRRR